MQVATISAEPATLERYNAIRNLMGQLGPRSILVDLRDAPDNHEELRRRQCLKRNVYTWLKDQSAQLLHPIGLRQTFGGMKYRQIPHIAHFAQKPLLYSGGPQYPDIALPLKVQVWMPMPERCALIVDFLKQQHPLLLVDERPVYEASLRRAVAIHLLTLFSTQIDILPEKGAC